MLVTVRLSAAFAQRIGAPRITMTLDRPATVASALDQLIERYPALATHVPLAVAVVHGEIVMREQPLRDGDDLALLAPVAGGEQLPTS